MRSDADYIVLGKKLHDNKSRIGWLHNIDLGLVLTVDFKSKKLVSRTTYVRDVNVVQAEKALLHSTKETK